MAAKERQSSRTASKMAPKPFICQPPWLGPPTWHDGVGTRLARKAPIVKRCEVRREFGEGVELEKIAAGEDGDQRGLGVNRKEGWARG